MRFTHRTIVDLIVILVTKMEMAMFKGFKGVNMATPLPDQQEIPATISTIPISSSSVDSRRKIGICRAALMKGAVENQSPSRAAPRCTKGEYHADQTRTVDQGSQCQCV